MLNRDAEWVFNVAKIATLTIGWQFEVGEDKRLSCHSGILLHCMYHSRKEKQKRFAYSHHFPIFSLFHSRQFSSNHIHTVPILVNFIYVIYPLVSLVVLQFLGEPIFKTLLNVIASTCIACRLLLILPCFLRLYACSLIFLYSRYGWRAFSHGKFYSSPGYKFLIRRC